MRRSSLSYIFIPAVIAMLVVTAVLQYVWIGKVSEGERERMRSRLDADVKRFADDFNRETQSAYFNFQLPAKEWKDRNWSEFNDRYDFWRERTGYPDLIKNFAYVDIGNNASFVYDPAKRQFVEGALPETLASLRPKLTAEGDVISVADDIPALVMPIYEIHERVGSLVVRAVSEGNKQVEPKLPGRTGFLLIELDPNVIRDGLLADLTKKYFAPDQGAAYDVSVYRKDGTPVFETRPTAVPDASVSLFDLAGDSFVFYSNRELMPKADGVQRSIVFSTTERVERRIPAPSKVEGDQKKVDVKVLTENIKPRTEIRSSIIPKAEGPWKLNLEHASGSIDTYITGQRRQNLAIGFGILGLIGASVLTVFFSAQRARLFAQRQVDFVSSVSHEFRTPLAVIYSASENLADGVAREPDQITRYGELIKGEGRKLSAMVEQILEFAGARSGKRTFDKRAVAPGEVVTDAIEQTRPMLDENGFEVEVWIEPELPTIVGDRKALSQAVQNLIVNALKYSNGSHWVRVEAERTADGITIAVVDRGVGIAAKDLKHIFEPFFRAKSVVDEQIHGNGLGLSLVKETVEAHGGRISVESEPGKGSRFVMFLRK